MKYVGLKKQFTFYTCKDYSQYWKGDEQFATNSNRKLENFDLCILRWKFTLKNKFHGLPCEPTYDYL